MITPLMTNKNKPKVIMVMGSVSKINTGFTSKRNTPKTTATIIADR